MSVDGSKPLPKANCFEQHSNTPGPNNRRFHEVRNYNTYSEGGHMYKVVTSSVNLPVKLPGSRIVFAKSSYRAVPMNLFDWRARMIEICI